MTAPPPPALVLGAHLRFLGPALAFLPLSVVITCSGMSHFGLPDAHPSLPVLLDLIKMRSPSSRHLPASRGHGQKSASAMAVGFILFLLFNHQKKLFGQKQVWNNWQERHTHRLEYKLRDLP